MSFQNVISIAQPRHDAGLLILRLGAGLTLSSLHGWGKLTGATAHLFQGQPWGFIGAVESLGFPLPILFALAAALAESIGGLLLAFGAFTRIAAAFVGTTMLVAIYRHLTAGEGAELAFLYLVSVVTLSLTGAGRYSVDAFRTHPPQSSRVEAESAAA